MTLRGLQQRVGENDQRTSGRIVGHWELIVGLRRFSRVWAERSSSAPGVGLCSAAILLLMFRSGKHSGFSRENPCPILLAVKLWSLVQGWAA